MLYALFTVVKANVLSNLHTKFSVSIFQNDRNIMHHFHDSVCLFSLKHDPLFLFHAYDSKGFQNQENDNFTIHFDYRILPLLGF